MQPGLHPARRDNGSTTPTFTGDTTAGVPPTPVVYTFPGSYGDGNATFDASWTGVTSVTITITGGYQGTVFLWAIYYTEL